MFALFFHSLCLQARFHPHQFFYLRSHRLLNISTLLSTLCQLEIPSQFLTFPFYANPFSHSALLAIKPMDVRLCWPLLAFSPSLPSQAVFSSLGSLHQPTPVITSSPTSQLSVFSVHLLSLIKLRSFFSFSASSSKMAYDSGS